MKVIVLHFRTEERSTFMAFGFTPWFFLLKWGQANSFPFGTKSE
jgi:hypothetical protein